MTSTLDRPDPQAPAEAASPRRRRRGARTASDTAPAAQPAQTARPRPARRAAEPVGDTSQAVTTAFTMLAILSLWVVAQMLVLGTLSQDRAQSLLYGQFRGELAGATAPLGPVVPVGDPVALLQAPVIGLEQVVTEGTASGDTVNGPGHQRHTVLPGQAGTSVVFGRATTNGAPFGDLADLVAGDRITTVTAQGTTDFTVLGLRRSGDPLPQPLAAGRARLTLVTAEGSGRLAALSADKAIFVDAESTKSFPAPPGLPAAVPDPEQPMVGDPGAYPLLALCLGLLLALTLGVVAAVQRWSTALVWVVATPLALALSWGTTDVVMRLLPNLI